MAKIMTEKVYRAALKRIDELLPLTGDDVSRDDPNQMELELLTDLVDEYETIHYPIGAPSFVDIIKLRMYEMGLTQNKVAEMIGISASRLSEIMHGKTEPSLSVARTISQKLDISPSIMLGV